MARARRWALVVAVAVALAYVGITGLLWAMQRDLVYPAPTLPAGEVERLDAAVGARTLRLTAADGTSLRARHRQATGERAVLFFHGNAEVAGRVDLEELLLAHGWDVLTVAFRGYPGSDGAPSEEGITQDARAAWDYATTDLGLPPSRIVLHGKSLGGGVAAKLAAEVGPAALVLESTFTSVVDVAREDFPWLPVGLLLTERWETASRAGAIGCPVVVLHGTGDGVIGVDHGRSLGGAFARGRYVEVDVADHGASLPVVAPAAREAYLGLLGGV